MLALVYDCQNVLVKVFFNGEERKMTVIEKINEMMSILRKECPFTDVEKISDFNKTTFEEHGFGTYPISNVLKYELKDGSWVAVRPSGTEPKIKIYYSIRGNDESDANVRFEMIQNLIKTRMGL